MNNSSKDLPVQIKNPKVSIIMNCFNCSKFLRDAIDSVYLQTFKDWEIVFWDNCSMDGSDKIARSYDSKLKYYRAEKHTDLGSARNLAVEKSSGDWIAFLDCDDYWLPEKLEKQLLRLTQDDENSIGLVYCKAKIEVMNSGSILSKGKDYFEFLNEKPIKEGSIFNDLLYENFIVFASVLIKRDYFLESGKIDTGLVHSEDYDIILKIAEKYLIGGVNEFLCVYRVHDSNESHKTTEIGFFENIKILSRYHGNSDAKISIKNQFSSLGIYLLRKRRLSGLYYILVKGRWAYLLEKILLQFQLKQQSKK